MFTTELVAGVILAVVWCGCNAHPRCWPI